MIMTVECGSVAVLLLLCIELFPHHLFNPFEHNKFISCRRYYVYNRMGCNNRIEFILEEGKRGFNVVPNYLDCLQGFED